MRTLIAVAAREDELLRARRHLGFDRLVVVAPRRADAALRRALEGLRAEVVEVPEDDLLGCLVAIEGVLARAGRGARVAVDGGTSAMSAAAFLACLAQGAEAWFLLHRAVRLPVLKARPVRQRFTEDEAAVLRAMREGMALDALAEAAALPLPRVRDALLRLRAQGAVEADAQRAAPTALGAYLRRGLVPDRAGGGRGG